MGRTGYAEFCGGRPPPGVVSRSPRSLLGSNTADNRGTRELNLQLSRKAKTINMKHKAARIQQDTYEQQQIKRANTLHGKGKNEGWNTPVRRYRTGRSLEDSLVRVRTSLELELAISIGRRGPIEGRCASRSGDASCSAACGSSMTAACSCLALPSRQRGRVEMPLSGDRRRAAGVPDVTPSAHASTRRGQGARGPSLTRSAAHRLVHQWVGRAACAARGRTEGRSGARALA